MSVSVQKYNIMKLVAVGLGILLALSIIISQDEIQRLDKQITNLKIQLEAAIKERDECREVKEEYKLIIELKKNKTLDKLEIALPQSILPESKFTKPYTIDYAGYIKIEYVTTVSNITISAEVLHQEGRYVLTYHITDEHNTIIIPVLPGKVIISFKNNDMLYGAQVMAIITYVY